MYKGNCKTGVCNSRDMQKVVYTMNVEKIEKIIEPCELFKTLPDLKNIPAPITAPITIIIEEKKLIFFFFFFLANEDSLFRFSFCNAFSFVKFTYLLYLKF